MHVHHYSNFDILPQAIRNFLDVAGENNFFHSIAWFQTLLSSASPPGDEISLYVAQDAGEPAAALVTKRRNQAGALGSRMLVSPSHGMYTSLYGPILQDGSGPAGLRKIIATIAEESPPVHVLRFDSLEHGSHAFDLIVREFRAAQMIVQPFFNFHNWFEEIGGTSIEKYLAGRSAQTRYLINRHVRRIQRSGRGRFEMVRGGPRLATALIDYELVDLQSWKEPEPYPFCISEIVHCAARAGALRLGLLYLDDQPAAAQIWIVSGGKATILRLHYASKFAKFNVGTVLTYEMFRHVIENDHVHEIDFGRGDDDYKKKWLKSSRERFGILVFNSRTVRGSLIASRHVGGHMLMSWVRKLSDLRPDVAAGP